MNKFLRYINLFLGIVNLGLVIIDTCPSIKWIRWCNLFIGATLIVMFVSEYERINKTAI